MCVVHHALPLIFPYHLILRIIFYFRKKNIESFRFWFHYIYIYIWCHINSLSGTWTTGGSCFFLEVFQNTSVKIIQSVIWLIEFRTFWKVTVRLYKYTTYSSVQNSPRLSQWISTIILFICKTTTVHFQTCVYKSWDLYGVVLI